VDVNTDMDKMEELMMHVWGLEKPNLLISVTGGASFIGKTLFHVYSTTYLYLVVSIAT
jgi:hypothetical protein